MNTDYRKPLPGTELDYFDVRAAVEDIEPGAYDTLPYTSRVLAEQLVRRCEPELLTDALKQLIERRRDLDFPWYPARVVCHDILGQTALVDLAGLRDAIAEMGGELIPLDTVLNKTDKISRDKKVVVHCRSGKRSAKAIKQLQEQYNFDNLYNLKGGILAWSEKVDESIPQY